MLGRVIIFTVAAAGCSAPDDARAHITVSDVSPPIDLYLASFEAANSDGKSLLTWRMGADAGVFAPYFQIEGITITEGTQDPLYDSVAYYFPGVHDRPQLGGCNCDGSIVTHLDQAAEKGTVDIDLMVRFQYDGACPGYCVSDFYETDGGTAFFIPPHPCDGGACLDQIGCPGEATDPIEVQPDDAGSFTYNFQYCPNLGIQMHTAHVTAHATVTPDSVQ